MASSPLRALTVAAALLCALALPATASPTPTSLAPAAGHPAATRLVVAAAPAGTAATIAVTDFLTPRQIRARLDLARPLSSYLLAPTEQRPQPDPDCATRGNPRVTDAVVYPARRSRTQAFTYRVPGRAWELVGGVQVLEYSSAARARAALARVKASVASATHYSVVCEAINPIVSGQAATGALRVTGTSFSWRNHVRASHAGAWRHVVSTRGNRLVWVTLGRQYRAELDWSGATPAAAFPRYPSLGYLQSLASAATARAL